MHLFLWGSIYADFTVCIAVKSCLEINLSEKSALKVIPAMTASGSRTNSDPFHENKDCLQFVRQCYRINQSEEQYCGLWRWRYYWTNVTQQVEYCGLQRVRSFSASLMRVFFRSEGITGYECWECNFVKALSGWNWPEMLVMKARLWHS